MNATKNYIGNNTTTRRTKAKTTAPTDKRLYLLDEAKQRHCRNTKKPKEISSCESTSNGFLKTTFLPKFRENDSLKLFGKSRKDLNQIQRKNAKKESDFYQSLSQLAEHYGIYPMETKDFEYPYNISLSIWDVKKKLNEKVEHWDHIGWILGTVNIQDRFYFRPSELSNSPIPRNIKRCKTCLLLLKNLEKF